MKRFERPLPISYDEDADAAYIRFSPGDVFNVDSTYSCDPVEVNGMINLDFDSDGRLVGIEVLDARSKLPEAILRPAQ